MCFQLLNITCHEARKISVLYSYTLRDIFAICSRFWDFFHVLCYVIPFHVIRWDGDSSKSETIHVIKYASVVTEARQSPSWSLKYTITQPLFPRLVLILSLLLPSLKVSETNYLCWFYSHILLLISFFIIWQFLSVKCESQLLLLSRPEHSSQIFIVKHLFVVTLNTDVSK